MRRKIRTTLIGERIENEQKENNNHSNSNNNMQLLKNGVHVYPYQYFDQPGYTSMKDVVCIHRVAQSWNPNAKGFTANSITDVKKKTLGYYKMKAQQRLAKFILNL